MHLRATRVIAATALTAALLVSGAAPAFSSPATGRPRPAATHSALARPLPGAVEPIQEHDMPAGGVVSDYLNESGNFVDIWAIPLHASQTLGVSVKVPTGMDITIELWDSDEAAEEPIEGVSGTAGEQIGLAHDADTTEWYFVAVYADGGAGRYTLTYDATDPFIGAEHEIYRIAGADRIKTAVEISKASYPTGADTVVIATGWNFADALAASGLCGSYDAPLLLTRPTQLPPEVAAEILRLGATRVFVIGSEKAVSNAVFASLGGPVPDKMVDRIIERIEGGTRYETAAAIALKIKQNELAEGRAFTGSAFIVNGKDFPDALSVAPYAFSQHMPILPVLAGSVPPATQSALTSLGTTEAILVGGESVLGAAAASQLNVAAKRRISGAGRTETAIAAANFAVSRGWASWSHIGLATGWNFPDALGGGVKVGKSGGVILLAAPMYMNGPTIRALYDHRLQAPTVNVFGSTRAVTGCVLGDAQSALDGLSVSPF